jgi:hypothetical protein
MSTDKLLGFLTLNSPKTRYIYSAEVGIPLLEGGLYYHGSYSITEDSGELGIQGEDSVTDLLISVNKHVTDNIYFEKSADSDTYRVAIPLQADKTWLYKDEAWLKIHSNSDNPQLFSGWFEEFSGAPQMKFTYRDINEPITLGVIALVSIGAMAIICLHERVSQRKECKGRVKATYGFNWKTGSLGCSVECLK